MNDTLLDPRLLAAGERRTYLLEVCGSMLGLLDEMIADHQGAERLRLLGVRVKAEHVREIVAGCHTDTAFDLMEVELTRLCDIIADDLDDKNKPS